MAPVATAMDELGAACLGIMHWSKSPTTVTLDRVNGSRAFTAAARSVIGLGPDPEDLDRRLLLVVKSNLGATNVPAVRFEIEGRSIVAADGSTIATSGVVWLGEAPGLTADDVFARNSGKSDRSQLSDFVDRSIGPDGFWWADLREAVKEAGFHVSDKTLGRVLDDLRVSRRRSGFGGKVLLFLPDSSV